MSQRFQIEDIITQGTSGVVFHATDTETGRPVAVRRFFPSGIKGAGLAPAEQALFRAAVERLTGLVHPALRGVVGGGCDPVDGMPFVVTEWVNGTSLSEWLKDGPVQPAEAITVLDAALEVSILLSQALGQESVWVETSLASIIVGDEASGRGITFWVSSSRWLDGRASRVNLNAIVHLAEDLLGWRGRAPSHKSGHGLGQWFQWLRAHAKSTDLATARAQLAALSAAEIAPAPPAVVKVATPPVAAPAQPAPDGPPKAEPKIAAPSAYGPLIFAGIAAAVVAVAAWWLLTHRPKPGTLASNGNHPSVVVRRLADEGPAAADAGRSVGTATTPPVSPAEPEDPAVAEANAKAAAMLEALQRRPSPARKPAPKPGARDAAAVFTPVQAKEIMALRNREVVLEGLLVAVIPARTGKSLYLEFDPGPPQAGFGILYVDPANLVSAKESLDPWVGKRVRIEGKVDIQHSGGTSRPKILMRDRAAVKLAE